MNKALLDSVTGLPHQVTLFQDLKRQLRQDRSLGLVVVTIHGLDAIEESQGPEAYDTACAAIVDRLRHLEGKLIEPGDILGTSEVGIPSFLIFLSKRQGQPLTKDNVQYIATQIEEALYPGVCQIVGRYVRQLPRLAVGHSLVVCNPLVREHRLIYRLIEDAKQLARLQLPLARLKNKDRLQEIIVKESITTVFQPIVNLSTRQAIGYEALTRGPEGTIFHSPLTLFEIAKEVGLIFELDRLCRKKALVTSRQLPSECKIFVNSLPTTIHDPEFRGKFLKAFLKSIDRAASNIVFEINERAAIDNFASFREATQHYTDQGIAIAIDDTGAGYSTLEAIVELKPQYLKFDISMVRGIHKDPLKQEMLRMLTAFAKNMDAQIIAEGIEEEEDLEMLKQMGLVLGQGYLFAYPMPCEVILAELKKHDGPPCGCFPTADHCDCKTKSLDCQCTT